MGEERDRLIRRLGEKPLSKEEISDADLMERRMEYYRTQERLPPEVDALTGTVLVVGYGTLLSRASVARTVGPEVAERTFTPVVVPGFKRLFNLRPQHYEPSFRLSRDPVEVAAANVQRSPGSAFNGLAFGVSRDELSALDERERYYGRIQVTIQSFSDMRPLGSAFVYSAESGSPWVFSEDLQLRPRWEDVLLARSGAYRVGDAFGEMFDQTTFLADGKTRMMDRYAEDLSPPLEDLP